MSTEAHYRKMQERHVDSAIINALPDPVRRYIHDLETRCYPAGDVATIAALRDQNSQLIAALSRHEANV